MTTLKQLLKEFWLPFLVAISWTCYNMYTSPADRNLPAFLKTFSASFFLISWATGQVVRVSRQARTDKGLNTVENRTIELTKKLDNAAINLINTITGGESFAYLVMSQMGNGIFVPFVAHSGTHPLSNISVRICDLKIFHANSTKGYPFESDININVGDLATNLGIMTNITIRPVGQEHDWNVFFSARNGLWTQLIRGRIIKNEWKFASVVFRYDGAETKTLFVSVPHGFPLIGEAQFDGAEREPPLASEV